MTHQELVVLCVQELRAFKTAVWDTRGKESFVEQAKRAGHELDAVGIEAVYRDALLKMEEKGEGSAKPPSISGPEMRAQNLPKPSWIIEKVLPEGGLIALSGKPKSFKSFFALWMAMKAASGLPLFDEMDEPFFCQQDTNVTPTMFIEEENTMLLTYNRYIGLRKVPDDLLHFRVEQQFKMKDETWRVQLLKDIQEKRIGLIIMDPFSSVMGLKDENSNAEVAEVMDIIRHEFVRNGISVAFIHHPAKGDGDGKNLRGAGDILGKCDVHLHFERDELDKRMFTVSYEKMRLVSEEEIQNFRVRLTGDHLVGDGHFRYCGVAQTKGETAREELCKEILACMMPEERYLKSELAKETGQKLGNDKFKNAWAKLEKDELIITCFEKKNGHPFFRLK
jgi:hypothetical protein